MKVSEIEKKYGITRQTLYNWEKKGIISTPKKDYKNRRIYNEMNQKEIENIILNKKKNTFQQLSFFNNQLKISNRRYLGSKTKLLNFIEETVEKHTKNVESVADIFAGTGVVADMFRRKGKKVIVNDILKSNFVSYETWFANDPINIGKIKEYILYLNGLQGVHGYVTENFGDKYFSQKNAMKIDAIRTEIEKIKDINNREKSFMLTSLLYAMDKVANTVGHYDAYRKKMDTFNPIYLKVPEENENSYNQLYNEDANQLVHKIYADLVYIDTPYNSRGYESAYHVLENIIEWKKPQVEGIANKAIDRKEKSSRYNKKEAPIAFEELIENINAKYILVSYNNMAKKGNSRSNAKISNEEILNALEKKGKVYVYSKDFNVFTTGKSKIDNHKELLYLCKVKEKEYIKSALNYTGGKYKLLPQIEPLFPTKYERFIDLFAGSGTVGVNISSIYNNKKVLLNDNDEKVVGFLRYLSTLDINHFIEKVEKCIEYYNLSNSNEYGYAYYNSHGGEGLSNFNKEKFQRLRDDYNNKLFDLFDENILFYLLIVFSFNNQIRFNKKGDFNLPVGKRDFNMSMRNKIIKFHSALKNGDIEISNNDFRNIKVKNGDFIYADPPYRITTATYNENNAWNIKDDLDLFNYLDHVHEIGGMFAMSNVIEHKGIKNNELIEWSKKYNVKILNYNYNNSNYQSKKHSEKTIEVLITNY